MPGGGTGPVAGDHNGASITHIRATVNNAAGRDDDDDLCSRRRDIAPGANLDCRQAATARRRGVRGLAW